MLRSSNRDAEWYVQNADPYLRLCLHLVYLTARLWRSKNGKEPKAVGDHVHDSIVRTGGRSPTALCNALRQNIPRMYGSKTKTFVQKFQLSPAVHEQTPLLRLVHLQNPL